MSTPAASLSVNRAPRGGDTQLMWKGNISASGIDESHNRCKMNVQLPALRSFDDFIFGSSRFQVPDLHDKDRLLNRVVNNLLYYQSNYFLTWLLIFLLATVLYPKDIILASLIVVSAVRLWALLRSRQPQLQQLKKQHPFLSAAGVVILVMLLTYNLGSLLIFLLAVLLPLAFMFIHASLRLRNLKNKVVNVTEALGLAKKTPMAFFLHEFDIEPEWK